MAFTAKLKIMPGIATHALPKDLVKALRSHEDSAGIWNGLTPLSRNEWICWVESAKLIETRSKRITRTAKELTEGKRRPCCWSGCRHRERTGKV